MGGLCHVLDRHLIGGMLKQIPCEDDSKKSKNEDGERDG
jgi:hypothetical protein